MKNVHMCYIGVTEGKIENLKKDGKMSISILIFIYTIHFAYLNKKKKYNSSTALWIRACPLHLIDMGLSPIAFPFLLNFFLLIC